MSEPLIGHETTKNNVRLPLWRMLINMTVAVTSAALLPFLACSSLLVLALVLVSLSDNALPALVKNLSGSVGMATYLSVYFSLTFTICLGAQIFVAGIPIVILGWRRGRINPRSSIIAGFLIGCIPWAVLVPVGLVMSFFSDEPFHISAIPIGLGLIPAMGFLGALEGLIFWGIWRLLSGRSASA